MATERLDRMRKARPDEFAPFDDLLNHLRRTPGLTEQRSAGTFHRGSLAFLDFHADGNEILADVKIDGQWERIAVWDERAPSSSDA